MSNANRHHLNVGGHIFVGVIAVVVVVVVLLEYHMAYDDDDDDDDAVAQMPNGGIITAFKCNGNDFISFNVSLNCSSSFFYSFELFLQNFA